MEEPKEKQTSNTAEIPTNTKFDPSAIYPSQLPTQPTNEHNAVNPPGKKISNKQIFKKAIPIVTLVVILPVLMPVLGNFLVKRDINSVINQIARDAGVDTVYDLSTVKNCQNVGGNKFGETTSLKVCSTTITKALYPKFKPAFENKYPRTDEVHSYTLQLYNEKNEETIYMQKYFEMLQSRRLSGRYQKFYIKLNNEDPNSKQEPFDNLWEWDFAKFKHPDDKTAFTTNVAEETDYKKVMENIPLTDGAPTTREALADSRTPLIIKLTGRSCRSIKFVFIDNLCILPR